MQRIDDLISRQAAIDAICKEGTRLERNGTVAMCEIKQWCIDLLERLPSAQPEIVRCKDCKYSHMTYDGDCKYCDIWFPDESEYMPGDYYCGSAERRQDE